MRNLIALLALTLVAASPAAPKGYPVHVGPVPSGHILAATATGGTLTVARQTITINPDESMQLVLLYSNAGGLGVSLRTLTIPANQANPITDQFGNQISASVPSSLGTAITSFLSQMDATIGAGATAGKLNL